MDILSVSELTSALRGTLEHAFPFVWVRGEITNLARPGSGHVYFALKDADALLPCVWFAGQQKKQSFDPLTGEVYTEGARESLVHSLQNGQEVMCAGALTVYPVRGTYQLRVEFAQESGSGRLAAAFEAMKETLAKKGFFDARHKKKIPHNPGRIALITAPTGAAVQDFLRVAAERGHGSEIRLYPVRVQGDEAAPEIVQAIQQANTTGWAELIVLIRGGGSLQDLWAFNEESVASAVYHSRLPVLTGIGHEIDTSIADLTADMRAATPSHAAQLLWTDRAYLIQQIDELEIRLHKALRDRLAFFQGKLEEKERQIQLLSPAAVHQRLNERLAGLGTRLENATRHLLADTTRRLDSLSQNLQKSRNLTEKPQQILALKEQQLLYAARNMLHSQNFALEQNALRLDGLNPLIPLQRGYALIKDETGLFIQSARESTPGQRLIIQWHDDSREARLLVNAAKEPQ